MGIPRSERILLMSSSATATETGFDWNPFSWFISPVQSLLSGLGGYIASGIESGFVSLLTDLWDVILGPLEVIAGVAIAVVILVFAFREDLGSLAAVVAMGAA